MSLRYTNINNNHSNAASHFLLHPLGSEAVFTNYLKRLADAETQRRLAVMVIALARYQAAQGRYPERLEELLPKYLEKVSVDFMDGKPLRYRRRADGDYLLYSVGLDGRDDGGMRDDVALSPVKPAEAKTNAPNAGR